MTEKYRLNLIREGNQIFNDGDIALAQKYFMKANYKDGMLRVADHFYYDKKLPLNALPLYIKCGSKERVSEIYKRMAFALGKMIQQDKNKNTETSSPENQLPNEPENMGEQETPKG